MKQPRGLKEGAPHCSLWHIPPKYFRSPNVYEGADVFCTIRDPSSRAVSQVKYTLKRFSNCKKCNEDFLNNEILLQLRKVESGNLFGEDCHWLSQSAYTRSADKEMCTRVIRFEEDPHSFNSVMDEYGYHYIRMKSDTRINNSTNCCDVSVSNLHPETRQLLKKVYAEDYSRLNYSSPV